MVVLAGANSQVVRLDVAPAANKLGREEHRELLQAVEQRVAGLTLGATAGTVGYAEAESELPALARYAEIRHRIATLERTFASIAHAPHRALVAAREERPLSRVRICDGRTIHSAIRRTPVRLALRGFGPPTARIDHRRHFEAYSTPPNQHLVLLLRRLIAASDRLAGDLQCLSQGSGAGADSPEVRARATAYTADAIAWSASFRRMRRAWFLEDVGDRPGAASLQAIAYLPTYLRFDRAARAVLTPMRSLSWSGLPLTSRPTYELYEIWCLFEVERVLRSMYPDATWRGFREFIRTGLTIDVGGRRALQAELPSGLAVELWYQPTFASWRAEGTDSTATISLELRPDFVLVVRESTGALIQFHVLDAKYRASAPGVRDALRDLHVYRDALRCDGARCTTALALVPNLDSDVAKFAQPSYIQAHAFGGVVVKPGITDCALAAVLRQLLTL